MGRGRLWILVAHLCSVLPTGRCVQRDGQTDINTDGASAGMRTSQKMLSFYRLQEWTDSITHMFLSCLIIIATNISSGTESLRYCH